MTGYGQFCAVARAHEAIGGRWSLLVVRELLCGERRFNDILRGVPRMSRTMLSERLQALVQLGAVVRLEGPRGPEYELTEAGRDLAGIIAALAAWGQRWLPRRADAEDIDLAPLLHDMQRRVRRGALPPQPLVVRFEVAGKPVRFLLLKPAEASFCDRNPGFPEALAVRAPLAVLAGWWRGDLDLAAARRAGLSIDGPKRLADAFPGWFERYLFADVAPARGAAA